MLACDAVSCYSVENLLWRPCLVPGVDLFPGQTSYRAIRRGFSFFPLFCAIVSLGLLLNMCFFVVCGFNLVSTKVSDGWEDTSQK